MGRSMEDIIIIDNLPHSYQMQQENGIPISSWYDDQKDRDLYLLMPILEQLATVRDVRPLIRRIVKNEKICLPTAQ